MELPPTAVFAGQNLLTMGAVRALQGRGLQHRVAVIGIDDFIMADLLDPGVSVIAQRPASIGTVAANMLFDRLEGLRAEVESTTIPVDLLQRGSGEIRPS